MSDVTQEFNDLVESCVVFGLWFRKNQIEQAKKESRMLPSSQDLTETAIRMSLFMLLNELNRMEAEGLDPDMEEIIEEAIPEENDPHIV